MSSSGNGPVALISGGGQGIGLGIAQALADAGYRPALGDIVLARAEESAQTLRNQGRDAIGLFLDVTLPQSWEQAVQSVVEQWGRLDVLVNNAGISPRGTAESTDEALWDRTMAINLKGPWLGIKTAMPELRKTQGAIINVGSTRATRPRKGMVAYGASKAGLLGLTRQVAIDHLDDGISCNMVCARLGRHAGRARDSSRSWPSGFSEWRAEFDHRRGHRRRRRLSHLSRRPPRHRHHFVHRRRPSRRR